MGWRRRNDGRGRPEGTVVQLKGRAEVHRRTLRRLHSDATLAARRIENRADIPLGIHVHLYSAFGPQRLVQAFVDARCLSRSLIKCEQHARKSCSEHREKDGHPVHVVLYCPLGLDCALILLRRARATCRYSFLPGGTVQPDRSSAVSECSEVMGFAMDRVSSLTLFCCLIRVRIKCRQDAPARCRVVARD
jgi:hypothetical protein